MSALRPGRRSKKPSWNSTTSPTNDAPAVFRITHPFHPLVGQEYALVDHRQTWGEDRVYTLDTEGRLKSFPTAWTSAGAVDPVVAMGAGRAHFRVEDLLELARLMASLRR